LRKIADAIRKNDQEVDQSTLRLMCIRGCLHRFAFKDDSEWVVPAYAAEDFILNYRRRRQPPWTPSLATMREWGRRHRAAEAALKVKDVG
jgi:hypothetical protein